MSSGSKLRPTWQAPKTKTPVRAAVRFPLALPLRVKTVRGVVEAITVDVSANGLLFYAGWLPEVSSRIEFTMALPGLAMGNDVEVHCVGRIVRHQRRSTDDLAAAVIDDYCLKARI